MKNKIKKCLNNESAGPNLEELIGIGIAMAGAVGLYGLAKAIHFIFEYMANYFKFLYKKTGA